MPNQWDDRRDELKHVAYRAGAFRVMLNLIVETIEAGGPVPAHRIALARDLLDATKEPARHV